MQLAEQVCDARAAWGPRGERKGRTAGKQILSDPLTDCVPLHCKTWQSELCRLCFVHWGGGWGGGWSG